MFKTSEAVSRALGVGLGVFAFKMEQMSPIASPSKEKPDWIVKFNARTVLIISGLPLEVDGDKEALYRDNELCGPDELEELEALEATGEGGGGDWAPSELCVAWDMRLMKARFDASTSSSVQLDSNEST